MNNPLNFHTKAAALFASALMLLLLTAGFALRDLAELRRMASDRGEGLEMMLQLEQLESSLNEVQSGARGFVLSGLEDSLIPYLHGLKDLEEKLQAIEAASARNSGRIAGTRELRFALPRMLDWYTKLILARRSLGHEGAMELVATGKGEFLTNRARKALWQMIEEEERLYPLRETVVQDQWRTVSAMNVAATLLALLLIAGAGWLVTRELNRRREAELRAHQAEEGARQFYYSVSHELKTPLTVTTEYISLILDGLAGPIEDRQRDYLTVALDSCHQLKISIDDLLDTTRLATGKLALDLESVPVGRVIGRTVLGLTPVAEKKGIRITQRLAQDLGEMPLDEIRVRQVLANLITNAIKFTPAGGAIEVGAVTVTAGEREAVRVSVADTGRGIPADQLEQVFERHHQVRTTDAAVERGLGLGLSICRELVKLHGGRIWVESEPGRGSTFHFTLPRAATTGAVPGVKPSVPAEELVGAR